MIVWVVSKKAKNAPFQAAAEKQQGHYQLTKSKLQDSASAAINEPTSAKNTTKNTKRKPRKTRP